MSRYDSHLKRLEAKINDIEAKLLLRDFPKLYREYAETGLLPANKLLRNEILKWKICVKQMIDTLPQAPLDIDTEE